MRLTQAPDPSKLEPTLYGLSVEELKWYAAFLPEKSPTRKAELIALLLGALTDPDRLRQLYSQLPPAHQHTIAEVVHALSGRYNSEILRAKYPNVPAPKSPPSAYYAYYGRPDSADKRAVGFDMFFFRNANLGLIIPSDLAAMLRAFVPQPPKARMRSRDEPPGIPESARKHYAGDLPDVIVSDTERAVFHDLASTLHLVQQGKAAVSPATRLPTLATLRALRQRMLIGDYLDDNYERAEDAIRPLALIMLAQAAKWAAPTGGGNKLELTRRGQMLLGMPLGAEQIRDLWESWAKTDLLDEFARIRAIRGQQAKGTRFTKPAERREKLAAALRDCPAGSWVELDEFFRYLRAQGRGLTVERSSETHLYLGSYQEYGWLAYAGDNYWDIVVGSYLRAVLFEYAATLGMIEIAYTLPEETPHSFGDAYGLDEYEFLSRYDGLLGIQLTNLGAYALGLTDEYEPPAVVTSDAPILKVLPNLDVVITDAASVLPNDRAFLERIAEEQSQNVYRLSRDQLLEAVGSGLDLRQVREFLAAKSGQPATEFPQIVRVFFEDLEKRLSALREAGRMVVIEGDDPYLLTELSNNPALRTLAQLGSIDGRAVLLVPEEQETAARRQLKKLGYIPKKG
jgi:Helicase conserved C-terminal domain